MGVDIPIGLVFAVEVAEGEKQDKMFEHVGMVTGMEGVAVAEHRRRSVGKGGIL